MNNSPRGYFWLDLARDFLAALVVALILISLGFLALGAPGCRSVIPVSVLQNNFNCQSTNYNNDGTIEFHQCTRDGTSPVEIQQPTTGPSGTGDDSATVKIPGYRPSKN